MSDVVWTCRRAWRRLGVPGAEADEMARELEDDLRAAAADGVAPADYVGGDPRGFATAWAVERGVTRQRPRLAGTAGAALAGAVPGALTGVFGAYAGVSDEAIELLGEPSPTVAVLLYLIGGAFAYAGAVGAVAAFLTWRQDPLRAPTVRGCAVALPVVIALAFGAASGVASTRDYATDPRTLAADVTVCVLVFLAGAALTRALVLLRAGASQRPSASPTNAW